MASTLIFAFLGACQKLYLSLEHYANWEVVNNCDFFTEQNSVNVRGLAVVLQMPGRIREPDKSYVICTLMCTLFRYATIEHMSFESKTEIFQDSAAGINKQWFIDRP